MIDSSSSSNREKGRLRLLGISLLYLLGAAVASVIIHEAAHVVAALSLGVPSGDIRVGFYGLNPSIFLRPDAMPVVRPSVIGYAGGIAAGMILLAIYSVWYRRFRKQPSQLYWILGVITVIMGAFQISAGFIEGRFHAAYLYYSSSVFNPLSIVYLSFVAVAFLLHYSLFPLSRLK